MKHKFFKQAAAVTLALNALPVIQAAAEETVTATAVSGVSWCGDIGWGYGTYPQRAIEQVTVHYPEAVAGELTTESFTVIDNLYKDEGVAASGVDFNNGKLTVEDVEADGSDVTITVSVHSGAGVLTSTDGNFRRKVSEFTVVQNEDVIDAEGNVISEAGTEISFDQDHIYNVGSDEFSELKLTSETAGNTIYAMVYTPEGYDASAEYPMVVHVTGGGQQYSTDTPDETLYGTDNYGVELDIDLVPSTFSVYAPEPTIVVTVQTLKSAADQPEGYDYGADLNQVVEYMEENYAVDTDRVYAIGNSMGGIVMSKAVAMRPDLYAAYVPCNTSIVSGDKSSEDTDAYQLMLEYCRNYVDNEVAIWYHRGENDFTGPYSEVTYPFNAMKAMYEEYGYTEEEIDELLKQTMYTNEDFEAVGSTYYHGATGLFCENEEAVEWLYEQTKADNTEMLQDVSDGTTSIYLYDASGKMTIYNENPYSAPKYIIYPDEEVSIGEAKVLLREMGVIDNCDTEAGMAYVVNPIGEYDDDDLDEYLNVLDKVIGAHINDKVIGIGEGATFVNNYVSQKDWMIAGILSYGGEAGSEPAYDVPAYVAGENAAEAVKPYEAAASGSDETRGYLNVVEGDEDETLREAFENAWTEVFSKNGRIGNIGGTFYAKTMSEEREFEYFMYLDCESLGLTRNVVDDVDLDGDGLNNLWYEYYPESFETAEDGTVPVVVMLHGNGNDPRTQASTSGWPKVAAENGIMLIEAEHQGGYVSGTLFDSMSDDDSMTYENGIIDMLKYVEEKYPQIDVERIYVEGLSKGSVNSQILGLTHYETFAAIGAHSAGLFQSYIDVLEPEIEEIADTVDVPAFFIGGTADNFPLTKAASGGTANTTLLSINLFEKLNNLSVTDFAALDDSVSKYCGMDLEDFGDKDCDGNTTIYGGVRRNEAGSVVLSVNAIEGWGHWNYEPAAQMMWDFFKEHTLHEGEETEVTVSGQYAMDAAGVPEGVQEAVAREDETMTVRGNRIITSLNIGTEDSPVFLGDTDTSTGTSYYNVMDFTAQVKQIISVLDEYGDDETVIVNEDGTEASAEYVRDLDELLQRFNEFDYTLSVKYDFDTPLNNYIVTNDTATIEIHVQPHGYWGYDLAGDSIIDDITGEPGGYIQDQQLNNQYAEFFFVDFTEKYPGMYELNDTDLQNPILFMDDDEAFLIDADMRGGQTFHDKVMDIIGDRDLYIYITHSHGDHLNNIAYFSPDEVAGIIYGADEPTTGSGIEGTTLDEMFGQFEAADKLIRYTDGMTFSYCGKEFEVIEMSNHTTGGSQLLDVTDRILFSGDTIGAQTFVSGTTVALSAVDSWIEQFDHSIEVLKLGTDECRIDTIIGGHTPYPNTPDFELWVYQCLKEVQEKGMDATTLNPLGNRTVVVQDGRVVTSEENLAMFLNGTPTPAIDDEAVGHVASIAVRDDTPAVETMIKEQPEDAWVSVNSTGEMTVVAEGEGLTYQWYYRNADGGDWHKTTLAGAKTATLTVEGLPKREGYEYRCVVKDAEGNTETSEAAGLRISTMYVEDVTAAAGETAVFAAEEIEGATYQWYYNGTTQTDWHKTTMEGAQTAELSVPVTAKRDGYQYRCKITLADGTSFYTYSAQLTVE